jgi:hypothetical protein
MKNYIFTTTTVLLLFTACKGPDNIADQNNSRTDSLMSVIAARDSSMIDLIRSFNEIEMNLDSVSVKQKLISRHSATKSDLNRDRKARINAEIKAINVLMEANNRKIKQLHRKYKESENKNVELEKTITLLNSQLNLKYMELTNLNEELNALSNEIVELKVTTTELSALNTTQSETINGKNAELHTAYYIVDKSSNLQQWNLIDNQGGFLGIGQTSKLSNNLDMNMFTKIDYTETLIIPINSKGIKVVTTHPTGSFSLEKTGKMVDNLIIIDPEKFWSASKYLVITK